ATVHDEALAFEGPLAAPGAASTMAASVVRTAAPTAYPQHITPMPYPKLAAAGFVRQLAARSAGLRARLRAITEHGANVGQQPPRLGCDPKRRIVEEGDLSVR